MSSLRKNPGAARAAFVVCWTGIACAVGIVCLAGCNSQPPEVQITSVSKPPASTLPALPHASSPMPSYPILLEDLPRYEAGLPVSPARSRLPSTAQRTLDATPLSSSSARASSASTGARAPSPAPISSRPPAPKTPAPSGIQYVP